MMTLQARPYAGLSDLQKMKDLQVKIKSVYPHSSFHIGELDWAIFYNEAHRDLSRCIRLWEDADQNLIAWTFLKDGDVAFDSAVHPDFRGSPEEGQIFAQMEKEITAFIHSKPDLPPDSRAIVAQADADETGRIAILEGRGFKGTDYMACLAQHVIGDLPKPYLPEGYYFLDRMSPDFADRRAAVHFSAFSPRSRMTPEAYRQFMTAPDYDPTLDTVVVAPDGRFASFAMGWIDSYNRLGIFEPVGTFADLRRLGFGKAVLREGLRRLKNRGAEKVLVNTGNNPAPIAFYESAGFQIVNFLRQYVKMETLA